MCTWEAVRDWWVTWEAVRDWWVPVKQCGTAGAWEAQEGLVGCGTQCMIADTWEGMGGWWVPGTQCEIAGTWNALRDYRYLGRSGGLGTLAIQRGIDGAPELLQLHAFANGPVFQCCSVRTSYFVASSSVYFVSRPFVV